MLELSTRHVRQLFVVVLAALVALAVAVPPTVADAATGIDRTSRSAVVSAYKTQLVPALQTPVTFSSPPDINTCVAGTESATSRNATMAAVNYYRAMAGLPSVANYAPWNGKAQAAALISDANAPARPVHEPQDWSRCWSQAGYDGASHANLSLDVAGAKAVEAYMIDHGDNNYFVGHRRAVLYPPSTRMGTGSTGRANALYHSDDEGGYGPRPTDVDWVAWPPSGHVPWEVLPHRNLGKTLFRWSLSSNVMPDADYSTATVTMKMGTESLVVAREFVETGYSDNTLVWSATRANGGRFPIEFDQEFTVNISGIRNAEVAQHQYTVKAVRAVPDTAAPPKTGYPNITGKIGAAGIMLPYNPNNPSQSDRKAVEVRIRAGATAPTRTTGARVCKVLVPRTTCTAKNLDAGVHYVLGIWAYDYAGNVSKRETAYINGTTVTASAPASARKGAWVNVSGSLYHGKPAARTMLGTSQMLVAQWRFRSNGAWGSWQSFASPATSNGSYVQRVLVNKTTQFRVKFEGSRGTTGDISPTKTVTVG